MNLRIFPLAAVLTAAVLVGCDKPEDSTENEELKRRIDQLEEEKRAAAEKEKAATEEELAKARDQLQHALQALEKEQSKPGVAPEVDVKTAGKAVVVDETPPQEPKPAAKAPDGEGFRVFFKELSRFGDWFGTDDYGYVWQPREARTIRGWQPYTRGRWLYSEQGWTWVSDESFRWATYHYGRWAQLEKHGWAWVPGDEWAPAWVSWRQSDEHIGWAPLPPETLFNAGHRYDAKVDVVYDLAPSSYAFVPVEHFRGPIATHCVPGERVMQVIVRTENVTRVETRREGVFCGGPDPAWLTRRLGAEVPRCNVRRHANRLTGIAQQRLQGNNLEVFAPSVRAPWNPAVRPQRVSEAWGRVAVVRGGGVMDRVALDRHRAHLLARQEAARRALEEEEVREALLRDRLAREEAARQAAARHCVPTVHSQLEDAYHVAQAQYDAAQDRLVAPNLNPQQRAYAEQAARNAEKAFLAAEAAYVGHMQQFHAKEWARMEAERRAEEERQRRMVCRPSEHEQLQQALIEAQRVADTEAQAAVAPNLNPKQLAYARLRVANANKALAAADEAFMAHLLKHHPGDHRRLVAERAELDAGRARADEIRRAEELARVKAGREAEEARLRAQARAEAEAARQAEMKARAEAEARIRAQREAESRARTEAEGRAEEERRREMVCKPAEHQQLEASFKAAKAEWETATVNVNKPNLNPKQLVFARKIADAATRKLAGAKDAYDAHLKKHHPQDYLRLEQERAQAGAEAEADRLADEKASALAERRRLEAEKARTAAEEARMASERRAAELAKAAKEKAESDRLAAERLREEELARLEAERAKEIAMARAKAESERRAAELAKAAKEKAESDRLAAERLREEELARLEAERAKEIAMARAKAEAERRAAEQAAKPGRVPAGCSPDVHKQLEAGLNAAMAETAATKLKLDGGRLNPRQAAYARKAYASLLKKQTSAQAAFDGHLKEHHPEEWKKIKAERAGAAKKAAEEKKRKEGKK